MITTKYNANDIVTLKLSTGEEVIGYFVSKDPSGITMRKPLVPVPTGDNSMGLAPYLMTSDYLSTGEEVRFNLVNVVTDVKTVKQIADVYVQQVSGINLSAATNSKILST